MRAFVSSDRRAAMEVAHEAPEVPLDADDAARGGLPSDDEEGPDDPDDEEFARPPGGAHEEEDEDGGEGMEVENAAGATTGAEAVQPPAAPPALPESLPTLTVPLIKEQLVWRNIKPASNARKDDLVQKLEAAVREHAPLLKPEDEGFEAVRAWYAALARAAAAGPPSSTSLSGVLHALVEVDVCVALEPSGSSRAAPTCPGWSRRLLRSVRWRLGLGARERILQRF